ncbi:VanZ family protein [uncultured Pseudoteredinibacter sp.]|uniref:VanZ family protein n=1 Tax=uncultured Pseudoteredinibacter sp. TaxID=1641701 RepID=UPI002609AF4A|nr:VanZ family protein [uncultured Pseudoteredinibacter sp.]
MRFWTHPENSSLVHHTRHLRWYLFGALLAIALFLNLSPSPGEGFTIIWDKALHFICWAAVTGALGLARYPTVIKNVDAVAMLLISSAAETGQLWVQGRSFDPADLLANSLGIASALIIWRTINHLRKHYSPN